MIRFLFGFGRYRDERRLSRNILSQGQSRGFWARRRRR